MKARNVALVGIIKQLEDANGQEEAQEEIETH
jgi:hypothetical protein